jgi:lipoyl(octanoyl) transferase
VSLDVRYLGLGGDLVDYRDGWDLQHRIHAEVVRGDAPDTLLLLEHASVYTAGKRTELHERPLDGTPVVDVDRGGKITWHGPGQLVGYPLVRLPEAFGVVDYVRRLEQALIDALGELGLATGRVPGRSGVWLPADPGDPPTHRPERKIAAIGVRVAGGVTMHGFALNADPDLAAFDRIVPCGIADAGVTSIAAELGTSPALTSLAYVLVPHLERLLAFAPYERTPDLGDVSQPVPAGPTYGLTVSVP